MRQVTFPNFCSPCLESLWLHLLKNVDLIDGLDVKVENTLGDSGNESNAHQRKTVRAGLRLVSFGERREGRAALGVVPTLQDQAQAHAQTQSLIADRIGSQAGHGSGAHQVSTLTYRDDVSEYRLPPPSYAPPPGSESYEIIWKRNGVVLEEFTNATSIILDIDEPTEEVQAVGEETLFFGSGRKQQRNVEGKVKRLKKRLNMEVEVRLHTEDVRVDADERLVSRREF